MAEQTEYSDVQQQADFDKELAWCLQHITMLIYKEKDEKKARDLSKNIASLKNPKVVLIKKRQIMNKLCGDYRTKMKKDEAKSKDNKDKVKFVENKKDDLKKSQFIKKALEKDSNLTGDKDLIENSMSNLSLKQTNFNFTRNASGESGFKFNFEVSQ